MRGRKIKLNDGRTLPPIDAAEHWELNSGGRIEVSRWNDLRMRQWPGQALALYRVIEYRAEGKPRYQRPLWLIFVAAPAPSPESTPAACLSVDADRHADRVPTPREAEAIYDQRFEIEHSLRFMKSELGLTCGQFNSIAAEGRVQVSRRDGGHRLLVLVGLVWDRERRRPTSSQVVAPWQIDAGSSQKNGRGTFVELGMEQTSTQSPGKVARSG